MRVQTERGTPSLSAGDIHHIAAWYAEVANPILRAAAETLEGLMELRARRGTPSLIRSAYTEEEITIAISVDGALKGLVLLGLSYRTAFRLLQQMLGEELDSNLPISDFLQESELARSALQEIANTLAGRAAMHLEASGKVCMISPPRTDDAPWHFAFAARFSEVGYPDGDRGRNAAVGNCVDARRRDAEG